MSSMIDHDVPGPKRDLVGYGRYAPRVIWPDDAKVAVSLVMNYEEGSEVSYPAGDERSEAFGEVPYAMKDGVRNLAVESVYEYGSRAGVWRLMRMFDEFGVKVTYMACGAALELNPELGRWIQESGHEPCSHGWRWEEPWLLSREEEREHIKLGISTIEETCGERPKGWYCRYGPSVNTRELLIEEGGFVYDSDSYADDLPYFTRVGDHQHLVVPYTLTYNDARYMMPQGVGTPSGFAESLTRALDELWLEGDAGHPKMMSIGLHARWIGQAGRIAGLRDFLEYALNKGGVWFPRRIDIAEWWLAHHHEFRAGGPSR